MHHRTEIAHRLQHLNLSLLVGFLFVALGLIYWGIGQANTLNTREDNPRPVEAELRIQRGTIYDVNNVVLAETTGQPGNLERVYPIPGIGPAVGYYSFRHGTAGVEEGLNSVLRGDSDDFWADYWRQTLHEPQPGRDIRLTLDADWQRSASALMAQQDGALVLLTLNDSAIRAMVSHPTYDPNALDEQFDSLISDENAPLLNRAVQSQYQPGLVLHPFILASALEAGLVNLTDVVQDVTRPVSLNGTPLTCYQTPAQPILWQDTLHTPCPNPTAQLGAQLGHTQLTHTFQQFGFTTFPPLPLITDFTPPNPINTMTLASVGQENLTITPLQVSLALSALANGGQVMHPQLVMTVETENAMWPQPTNRPLSTMVSSEAANALFSALPRHNNLIAEYATLVLSGPEGSMNSWYLGVAPAGNPRYAIVVVIENATTPLAAQQPGRALLQRILSP